MPAEKPIYISDKVHQQLKDRCRSTPQTKSNLAYSVLGACLSQLPLNYIDAEAVEIHGLLSPTNDQSNPPLNGSVAGSQLSRGRFLALAFSLRGSIHATLRKVAFPAWGVLLDESGT